MKYAKELHDLYMQHFKQRIIQEMQEDTGQDYSQTRNKILKIEAEIEQIPAGYEFKRLVMPTAYQDFCSMLDKLSKMCWDCASLDRNPDNLARLECMCKHEGRSCFDVLDETGGLCLNHSQLDLSTQDPRADFIEKYTSTAEYLLNEMKRRN